MQTKPTETITMLTNTTARKPTLGRYHDDSNENVNSCTASGANDRGGQRRIAHHLLNELGDEVEQGERTEEHHGDGRRARAELGITEQSHVE